MKIVSIDTLVDFYRTNLIIVSVHTDEGIVAEAAIGLDPTRILEILYELARDWYWRGGPVIMIALSSLEMALWDISARDLGVPVSRLLGGASRDRVRA